MSKFYAQLVNSVHSGGEPRDCATENHFAWCNIVQEFTHRQLTKDTDRPHVLPGLARRMSSKAAGEYVCGLWREKLVQFLMWKADYAYAYNNNLSTNFPGNLLVSRCHKEYYAPSWPWASIPGPVKYEAAPSPIGSDGKVQFLLNKCEAHWQNDSEDRERLLNILSIQCAQPELTTFRPPRSASLTVRSFLAPATLQIKREVLPNKPPQRGGVLLSTSAPGSKGPVYADFEPDVFDEYAEVFVGDELFLLFMGESRTGKEGFGIKPNGNYDGLYEICFGGGLVLRHAANDSDAY